MRHALSLMPSVRKNPHNLKFLHIFAVLIILSMLGGCAQNALSPRLPTYFPVGTMMSGSTVFRSLPHSGLNVGLYMLSDDSEPWLAPALPDSMLAILRNRLRQNLLHDQVISVVTEGEDNAFFHRRRSTPNIEMSSIKEWPNIIVAIMSSVEHESPTHLGAQPIMTQMPGQTIENYALAELALVDARSQKVVFHVEGQASATMDELTVPFGETIESGVEGRDILRANSAQAALDRALVEFQKKWREQS